MILQCVLSAPVGPRCSRSNEKVTTQPPDKRTDNLQSACRKIPQPATFSGFLGLPRGMFICVAWSDLRVLQTPCIISTRRRIRAKLCLRRLWPPCERPQPVAALEIQPLERICVYGQPSKYVGSLVPIVVEVRVKGCATRRNTSVSCRYRGGDSVGRRSWPGPVCE
jgi:hypothetical protein